MKKKILLICIISTVLCSCKQDGESLTKNEYQNKYKIEIGESINFGLDTDTAPFSDYVQFVDMDTAKYFTFVNKYNNSIYFYDYPSKEYSHKIKYEKEGADGVGAIQGYLYINNDSIFVYSYNLKSVCLTNAKGEVIKRKSMRVSFDINSGFYPASPYVSPSSPMRRAGDVLVMSCFQGGETSMETTENRPGIAQYDFVTDSVSYTNGFPEQYIKYNWGGGFGYRLPYFDVNSKNEIVISFAAANDIRVYNIDEKTKKTYLASYEKASEMVPFDEKKDINIDDKEQLKWYKNNTSYESIYYDKYNKVYYRFCLLPDKEYDSGIIGNRKPVVVVILNEDFERVGESQLPTDKGQYFVQRAFVATDGLYVQMKSDDENFMKYTRLEFSEI